MTLLRLWNSGNYLHAGGTFDRQKREREERGYDNEICKALEGEASGEAIGLGGFRFGLRQKPAENEHGDSERYPIDCENE